MKTIIIIEVLFIILFEIPIRIEKVLIDLIPILSRITKVFKIIKALILPQIIKTPFKIPVYKPLLFHQTLLDKEEMSLDFRFRIPKSFIQKPN